MKLWYPLFRVRWICNRTSKNLKYSSFLPPLLLGKILTKTQILIYKSIRNNLADFNNVNKECLPKKSFQKISPKKFLQKNSSQKIPPQKNPKNFQTISQNILRFWKYPIPYIALRGLFVAGNSQYRGSSPYAHFGTGKKLNYMKFV